MSIVVAARMRKGGGDDWVEGVRREAGALGENAYVVVAISAQSFAQ